MTSKDRLHLERLRTQLQHSLAAPGPAGSTWLVHLLHDALVELERILALRAPSEVQRSGAITRAEAALSTHASLATTARHSHTILIVDDDYDIRRTFSEILEDEGYSTIAARNGADALQILHEKQRPCVVLLDLMMPVVDGWEVVGRLSAFEDLAGIPIVLVTAFGEHAPDDRRISAVLRKPVEVETLVGTIARFCKAA
jgi:CheY-like chemotaxis protein